MRYLEKLTALKGEFAGGGQLHRSSKYPPKAA
jgi:hypothetical protein